MNPSTVTMLAAIVAATNSQGYMFVGKNDDTAALESGGFIEVNAGMQNPNNPAECAARVTDAGKAKLVEIQNAGFGNTQTSANVTNSAPTNTTPAPAEKPTFERVKMAIPASAPRAPGGIDREEKYPFADLSPVVNGQMDAIFVAPTDKMKDPATSLVSAVSAANRRYGVIIDTKTNAKGKQVNSYGFRREFKVFPSTDAGKPGAWIGRVDDGSRAEWTAEQFKAAAK